MIKKLLLTLVPIVLLTQCGTQVSKNAGDTLTVAVPVEAVSLYPYGSNDNASARVVTQIYETLVNMDDKSSFHPSLATSWEFVSPSVLQMKLRQGVKFHNGEIFSAKDVKFSLETMIKSSEVQHIASPIKQVDIISEDTVNIVLHAPFAAILSHLAHSASSIVNEKAITENQGNVNELAIGTGAFKLVKWNRGQSIVLEKNEEYWQGPAKINSLEFRVVPEATARTIALETGDVDIAYDIDSVDRERVSENRELVMIEKEVPRIEYIGFNLGKNGNPIWKDLRVRQAVAYAIDVNGIISSILFDSATPADSLIYKSVVGHYDGLTPREFNMEKAKSLIQEAGVPNGTKVTLWSTEGQRQKIMEIVQANLMELGFDARIQVSEWGRYLDGTSKGEHDIFILGWTTITGDADYGIYNLVHTSAFGGPGNRSFYSNPKVDNLLDLARKEINVEKRNALYKDVQTIIFEEIPFVSLYYKMSNIATRKNIQGLVFSPTDSHNLYTVSFKQ